eukprot:TRINITY_DN7865_c0_g1_i1.p4 TRINITY_DN7865_c0_g1~~TRINITY_DN7865_c0_g1_i1.p4  ORF type:complete len:50 (+),score=2.78 TRINITY_DN7865_c0_g1_i1:178-327(+)
MHLNLARIPVLPVQQVGIVIPKEARNVTFAGQTVTLCPVGKLSNTSDGW